MARQPYGGLTEEEIEAIAKKQPKKLLSGFILKLVKLPLRKPR